MRRLSMRALTPLATCAVLTVCALGAVGALAQSADPGEHYIMRVKVSDTERQIPVLADMDWQGRPRKTMLWANRNGMYYVLDRVTGEFLKGAPFVKVNWATGFDAKGRPIQVVEPSRE